jgi:hypothetical protein
MMNSRIQGTTPSDLEAFLEHPDYFHGEEDRCAWLFEDVSFREYYRQAGNFAAQGEEMHAETCEQIGRCPGCFHKQWDCQCYRRRGNAPKSIWAYSIVSVVRK